MGIKDYLQKYGKTGLLVYLSLSGTSFLSIYMLIKTGFDFKPLLTKLNIKNGYGDTTGSLIAAYAINKALIPVKLLIAASITPRIHSFILKFKNK
jgi:hypothetical protein